jgi:hypothetical protein
MNSKIKKTAVNAIEAIIEIFEEVVQVNQHGMIQMLLYFDRILLSIIQ